MKTFVAAKIHGIRVTAKSVRYHGSVAICSSLMQEAGIQEYEQVHIVNLTNGNRWMTYAIPAEIGQFSLNGGGARLGELNDECVIMTFEQAKQYTAARVVHVDDKNAVTKKFLYRQSNANS